MRAVVRFVPFLPVLLLAGCGGRPPVSPPTGNDEVSTPVESLDASEFVAEVDNPLLPLTAGSEWVYRVRSLDGERRVTVSVLEQTREVDGVAATVVRAVVTGPLDTVVAETSDFYAQDRAGNVWYLGEETVAHDGGVTDTDGSWQTGVLGAGAGIAMLAEPRVGDGYRMEHLVGEAEDVAEVLALDAEVAGPAGSWSDVLQTQETTRLAPDVVERKYYAAGIGLVREETVGGDEAIVELIGFTPGA